MQRRAFLVGAPLFLASCGAEAVWAPDEALARVAYRHPGPTSLTLITVRNVGTDNGAHTGLMISASQRVIFDPAGTFGHASIPERNDLVYGISPRIEDFYLDYHTRVTYYTVTQTIEVPPDVAELAFRLAQEAGPVPKAACTTYTSRLLAQLPGFTHIRTTLFPNNLQDQFGALPGVVTQVYRENDSDDKEIARAAFDAEVRAASE